jgi:hypothetical protein
MGGVTHLNKNIDAKTPLHRITGSMAYGNLPRNVHFIVDNPDTPGQRLFKQAKCNNAPRDLPAIGFEIVTKMIPSAKGEIETCYPVFASDPVVMDLKEAMAGRRSPGPVGVAVPKLAKFLLDFLGGKGPVMLGEIAQAAGDAGHLGKQKEGKWTMFTNLYDAIKALPGLPRPDDGWKIVTSRDEPDLKSVNGNARWVVRRVESQY